MSATAATSSASCRLAITMLAPASARPGAIAFPSPRLPPVTSAARPERLNKRPIEVGFAIACILRPSVRSHGALVVEPRASNGHRARPQGPTHATQGRRLDPNSLVKDDIVPLPHRAIIRRIGNIKFHSSKRG